MKFNGLFRYKRKFLLEKTLNDLHGGFMQAQRAILIKKSNRTLINF